MINPGLMYSMIGQPEPPEQERQRKSSALTYSMLDPYVSPPDVIREVDQAIAFRLNRVEQPESEYPFFIEEERQRILEAYHADRIDEQELAGVMQFLDMRERALDSEVEAYGRLESARTALTDDGLGYAPPDDEWWRSSNANNRVWWRIRP